MKIRANAAVLVGHINALASIAPTKALQDVVRNIRVEASDNRLTVTGTDLTVTARQVIEDVEVEADGGLLVDARDFMKVLKGLEKDDVVIEEAANTRCEVRAGRDRFKVAGEHLSLFPRVPVWREGPPLFQITSSLLESLVRRTHFAASKDEMTRHTMHGLLVEIKEGYLRTVATDGRRMALCERDLDVDAQLDVLVPKQGLMIMPKLFESGAEVEVQYQDTHVLFRTPGVELAVNLVEGEFPPYTQALKMVSDNQVDVQLVRKDFLKTMKRATILCSRSTQAVRFCFDDGRLVISAYEDRGAKESHVEHEIDYARDQMVVGFNPHHIVEGLEAVDGKKVILRLRDENSPAVIREDSEDGTRYTYVVMPISLGRR